jgi:hypothetical protein
MGWGTFIALVVDRTIFEFVLKRRPISEISHSWPITTPYLLEFHKRNPITRLHSRFAPAAITSSDFFPHHKIRALEFEVHFSGKLSFRHYAPAPAFSPSLRSRRARVRFQTMDPPIYLYKGLSR